MLWRVGVLAARHGGAGLARFGCWSEHGVYRIHVEEVRERVAPQAQADSFKAYYFVGRYITQVHVGTQ